MDKLKQELMRSVSENMAQRFRRRVRRPNITGHDSAKDMSLMTEYAKNDLPRYLNGLRPKLELTDGPSISTHQGKHIEIKSHEELVAKTYKAAVGAYTREFDFTLPSGRQVISPPYDTFWTIGQAESGPWALIDGEVLAYTPDGPPESAAGIGVHLTTDEPVLASITPNGTCEFFLGMAPPLPHGRISGGLGITVWTDGDPSPTFSRQAILWDFNGLPGLFGIHGSGQIADAHSPAVGFGFIRLAPVLLNMVPGARYLLWIWCWNIAQHQVLDGLIGYINFSLPSIAIDAGPPLAIH